MEAPAPAVPRCGGRCGLHVLRFHMYEAPPGAHGGPPDPEQSPSHFGADPDERFFSQFRAGSKA